MLTATLYVKSVVQEGTAQQYVTLVPTLDSSSVNLAAPFSPNTNLVLVITDTAQFNTYKPGEAYTFTLTLQSDT